PPETLARPGPAGRTHPRPATGGGAAGRPAAGVRPAAARDPLAHGGPVLPPGAAPDAVAGRLRPAGRGAGRLPPALPGRPGRGPLRRPPVPRQPPARPSPPLP